MWKTEIYRYNDWNGSGKMRLNCVTPERRGSGWKQSRMTAKRGKRRKMSPVRNVLLVGHMKVSGEVQLREADDSINTYLSAPKNPKGIPQGPFPPS